MDEPVALMELFWIEDYAYHAALHPDPGIGVLILCPEQGMSEHGVVQVFSLARLRLLRFGRAQLTHALRLTTQFSVPRGDVAWFHEHSAPCRSGRCFACQRQHDLARPTCRDCGWRRCTCRACGCLYWNERRS